MPLPVSQSFLKKCLQIYPKYWNYTHLKQKRNIIKFPLNKKRRVALNKTANIPDAESCPTRKLSDKTQPNDTRNCRTVSLSNTFLRPEYSEKPVQTTGSDYVEADAKMTNSAKGFLVLVLLNLFPA